MTAAVLLVAGDPEGLSDQCAVHSRREVVLEGPAVCSDLTGTWLETDTGYGLLATTGCDSDRHFV